jgi:hypothetical protein
MKWILITLILKISFAQSQIVSFEQIALDYYTKNIHPLEFKKKNKYLLKDVIINQPSSFLYGLCFDEYKTKVKSAVITIRLNEKDSILKSTYFAHLNSRRNRNKNSVIYLYKSIISPFNTVFVEIVVEHMTTATHYYIEMTAEKTPVQWCETKVVF